MPHFDSDRVRRLIAELRKAVVRLNALAELPRDKFLGDEDKIGSAKYHFIMAIEAMMDICNHVISRSGYRSPEDYADSFTVLGEQGAFEPPYAETVRNMARFRNRLVHLYWEVDNNQLYKILQTRLGDFGAFLENIGRFLNLERHGKDS